MMSVARPGALGATRICPHCKATVLDSASICPGCQHHLRFNAAEVEQPAGTYSALRLDARIQHRVVSEACEYCVVLTIQDERGQKLTRQVVGVGALQPEEWRNFSVSVELMPARTGPASRRN